MLSIEAKSQNKIIMISGKVIDAESYRVSDMFITYKKYVVPDSTARHGFLGLSKGSKHESRDQPLKAVDRYDVFSIIRSDSTEEIIYTPDTVDFTVEEARRYIQGEQMAMKYYKKPANQISSAAIGLGSSVLSYYALPIPMLYSVILGRFNPKPSRFQLPAGYNREVVNDEPFKIGYQKAARNMKIQQSLKWGYIGLGVGLTTLIIYGATSK